MKDKREYYIDELREADATGRYYLYSCKDKLENMTLEELENKYMIMRNYLLDAGRYDY